MKKNALGLLVAFAVMAPVAAQAAVQLPAGTQELGVQGNAKLGSDYQVNLNGSYGKFIKDNWELGGTTSINLNEHNKLAKVGVFTEYNFVNSTNWVPYVGAATELAALNYTKGEGFDADAGKSGDSWALNVKLSGGVKYFINPNVALSAEVNYNIATDDIEFTGSKLKNSMTNVVFGTRFYF